MIVIEKNAGTKIPYEVDGTRVCFDDDLTVNLAKRQQDDPVHIDICYDQDRELVVGAAAGRAYVAEIDIPARTYTTTENEDGEASSEPEDLDMDKVTLTLWAIE